MHSIILVAHLILTAFLIGIILLQRSDADGTGLGGGDATKSMLAGRSSGNVLTRTTAILAALFMLTSLGLSLVTAKPNHASLIDRIGEEPAAVAPAATAPATKPEEKANTPVAPVVPKSE